MTNKNFIAFTVSVLLLAFKAYSQADPGEGPLTANQVIDLIKQNVTCNWAEKTVDTFKTGDPNNVVTGIATTFMATLDVLKKAKAQGCNLIITHEPTFYNHLDETAHFGNDAVLMAKMKYIEDNNLVIFRFHDHIHRTQPDGIYEGVINQLWLKNMRIESDKGYIYKVNKSTVGDLAAILKRIYNNSPIRVVGNPEMEYTHVAFVLGAPGYMAHVRMLERNDVDVIVAGEVPEWESIPYVRDATSAGIKKAMILVGHVNSEEGGMQYCAEWMEGFVKGIPIHFIEAGDPFWTP